MCGDEAYQDSVVESHVQLGIDRRGHPSGAIVLELVFQHQSETSWGIHRARAWFEAPQTVAKFAVVNETGKLT